jgi:ketosteroid isomerase-like protein
MGDTTQIRELFTEHVRAMHDRDSKGVLGRFAPEIVRFDLAPPLRRTDADAHDVDRLENWFAGFDGPIGLEIRDLEVTAGADVAFATSLNKLSATPLGSPVGFDLWYRATTGLRKVDGRWLITHEHYSTPFHMEMSTDGSFRAATDLEP